MALTLVGGSNYIGRYLLRNIAKKYKKIQLADMYPFRNSVYALQEELKLDLEKNPLQWRKNLHLAVEGADEVIIVAHDYFKLAHSKNFYLSRIAQSAKAAGVKKLTYVNPLEFLQLNPEDGEPFSLAKEAENKAREAFPEMAVLNVNLLFGDNVTSLILKHAMQHINSGSILSANNGAAEFAPVHESDFLAAFNGLKPKDNKTLIGPEVLNYGEMVDILAKHAGKAPPSHGGFGNTLAASLATSMFGDAIFPSHIAQFYRLLQTKAPLTGDVKGKVKFGDHYKEGAFSGVEELDWHNVIVD